MGDLFVFQNFKTSTFFWLFFFKPGTPQLTLHVELKNLLKRYAVTFPYLLKFRLLKSNL